MSPAGTSDEALLRGVVNAEKPQKPALPDGDHPTAVFGVEDGVSSAMGVILGAGLNLTPRALLVVALSLAVSASVSMAGGQWLATGGRRQAAVMGLATFGGSFLPAAPWLVLRGTVAFVVCLAVAVALGVLIAELRPGKRSASYAVTFGVLAVATGAGVGASVVAGVFA